MKTVEEALEIIRKHWPDWGETYASISEADFGVTTKEILADRDYPPFDRVMMDGIAVSWKAFEEGVREFRVDGLVSAGQPQAELTEPWSCFEVMTGAPLPRRAELVIPYEDLLIQNGKATLKTNTARKKMEFVHLKGSDASKGAVLLGAGSSLNGPTWGIAASVGVASIPVRRSPRIQVISTGNELVPVDQAPLDHQIRRSNAYALRASLLLHGYREVTLAHLEDEPSQIEEHYQKNKKHYDLMIYSGGVSQGKFDFLPATWKKAGVTEYLHGVFQRPGKPLWFGVDEEFKTVVVGLPGNPVSSLVCLHRYFLSGKEVFAQLTKEFTFKPNLTYFLPVQLEFTRESVLKAHPLNIKNSGEFTALAESDGFLEIPKDRSVCLPGESFLFHSWRPL